MESFILTVFLLDPKSLRRHLQRNRFLSYSSCASCANILTMSIPLHAARIFLTWTMFIPALSAAAQDLEPRAYSPSPVGTSFVGIKNQPTPIPESQIGAVRSLMQAQLECRPHPYLNIGQRVRIQSGVLQGLEGILIRIANDQSLIVSVDLIQRSVAIRLEGYEVDGL